MSDCQYTPQAWSDWRAIEWKAYRCNHCQENCINPVQSDLAQREECHACANADGQLEHAKPSCAEDEHPEIDFGSIELD